MRITHGGCILQKITLESYLIKCGFKEIQFFIFIIHKCVFFQIYYPKCCEQQQISMHFSVSDTQELVDESGSTYLVSIFVDMIFKKHYFL